MGWRWGESRTSRPLENMELTQPLHIRVVKLKNRRAGFPTSMQSVTELSQSYLRTQIPDPLRQLPLVFSCFLGFGH